MCGLCNLFSCGRQSGRDSERFCNCYVRRREPEMHVHCANSGSVCPCQRASCCAERSCSCGRNNCQCRDNCGCR